MKYLLGLLIGLTTGVATVLANTLPSPNDGWMTVTILFWVILVLVTFILISNEI
jgi:hypothetical protein